MAEKQTIRVKQASGNVFADLGLPNAEEHQLKAQLVGSIHDVLRSRKLTQSAAAALLGLSQPDVSRLLRGQFRDYSLERLLRLLTTLDRDVDIVIRRKPASLQPSLPLRSRKPDGRRKIQGSPIQPNADDELRWRQAALTPVDWRARARRSDSRRSERNWFKSNLGGKVLTFLSTDKTTPTQKYPGGHVKWSMYKKCNL